MAVALPESIVGRRTEREAFAAALDDGVGLVFVHGPAGVGKSTLLRALVETARAAGRRVRQLDARDFPPSPRTFRAALHAVGGVDDSAPTVVVVDTYELLASIDDWMQREVWSALPSASTLVLAGRLGPAPRWAEVAAARGRRTLELPLRNLGREDAVRLLATHGVAAEHHAPALALTGGHPLALTMIGELSADRAVAGDVVDDAGMLHRLVRRLLSEVLSPARRRALEAASVVRSLTEARLAALLEQRDVGELFAWLGSRTVMQRGRHAIYLHDFAREVVVAELRWRDPAWFDTLVLRAHHDGFARFFQAPVGEQLGVLDDLSYLHRFNPMAQLGLDWAACEHYVDEAGPADLDVLDAALRRHEGDRSAALVLPWIVRRPADTIVYRDRVGRPAGFLVMVALERATAPQLEADPVSAAVWRSVTAPDGPCAHGEGALLFRSWMSAEAHHAPSPIWNLVSHSMLREGLMRPKLGWSGAGFANPDFWAPFFAYFNLQRFPALDYDTGRVALGMFGNDHRLIPRSEYGTRLAARLEASPSGPVRPLVAPQPVLLERERFAVEVRRALRRLWREPRHRELLRNPLLHARAVTAMVAVRANPAARVAALRSWIDAAVIRASAGALGPGPRAALEATFGEAVAAKGPVLAEQLGLSFPTYRRVLARAIDALVDELWRSELAAA
ncbi:MAG TPA: AAA family ATPase [Kofleriaceae bacterium]|nr:AAA family ATPase [Kofleriaceae bacterium]